MKASLQEVTEPAGLPQQYKKPQGYESLEQMAISH